MSHPHPRRKLRRLVLPVLLACFACSGESITFTPEEDSAIMARLESSWAGMGEAALQLALCEDQVRSAAWVDGDDCQTVHVVRGDGRGLRHKEELPGGPGCGGCPFEVLAYVQGSLSGGPFAAPVQIQGRAILGDLHDVEAIFAFPYRLSLTCTGEAAPCYMAEGLLQENGQLELVVHLDSDMKGDHVLTLRRQGAKSCAGE